MNKMDVRTLKSFATLGEAQVTKALLDAAGIPSSLIHDTLASVMPYGEFANVELCVNEADLTRAQQVISAGFDRAEFEAEVEESQAE